MTVYVVWAMDGFELVLVKVVDSEEKAEKCVSEMDRDPNGIGPHHYFTKFDVE